MGGEEWVRSREGKGKRKGLNAEGAEESAKGAEKTRMFRTWRGPGRG